MVIHAHIVECLWKKNTIIIRNFNFNRGKKLRCQLLNKKISIHNIKPWERFLMKYRLI